jgi:hypothetical protein
METQGSIVAVGDELVDADASELAAMVPPRFTVRDEKSADWLVRKLVEAEAHIRRVKEQAEREIRRTEREREFLLYHFGNDLEKWAQKQLAKSKGRRKSLLLLSGTVGFRTIAAKLVVENDTAVLAWAKKHCRTAVVVTERVSKAAIDEHFEANGDLPDGARLEPAHERFYVK